MCTAVSFISDDLYFGRTLDHTRSYGENVVITPRNFPLPFRHTDELRSHYAIIGMAHVAAEYPLYYDGINEKGLAMAGLNFVGYAAYGKPKAGMDNITQFELLPWILGRCADVDGACELLGRLNLTDTSFSEEMPASQLHWMIADKTRAVVVEAMQDGLKIHENPYGVMTNNPEFDWHARNMSKYMHLSPYAPRNNFANEVPFEMYSNGLGAVGLPGDLSSPSRFVRAAFMRANTVSENTEKSRVSRFFHIMQSVEQPRGSCLTPDGMEMYTVYTSCCNADKGIYYYKTYDDHAINGVDMHKENLNADTLITYPLQSHQINIQN